MGVLHPNIGEVIAGLQFTGPGSLPRPSLAWEQDPDTGIRHRGVQGEFSFISNAVEVARVTADGLLLALFTPGSVLFAGAGGVIAEDTGLTYASGTDLLTVVGGVITAAAGPTAARQHTLPDVASDTIALLTATQELDNKTLDSSVGKGTWTASGTWTLPALTLGGTVSGTPTWASSQAITLSTAAQPNVTSLGTLAANLIFTDNTYDIGASGATRPKDLYLAGRMAIGGNIQNAPLAVYGTYSGTSPNVMDFGTIQTANSGSIDLVGIHVRTDLRTAAAADTYGTVDFVRINPTLTVGSGSTVTAASSLRIVSAPTGGTNNYALWVDAGLVRLDSSTSAGAGAGTITNVPNAGGGNPAVYFLINLNGTSYAVPGWAL